MKLRKIQETDIQKVVELYNSGLSTRAIEKHVPIKKTRITSILNNHNVKMKTVGNPYRLRTYAFDENYFDNIDNQEKAYWLGFIAADGHVSDDGLVIGLCIKDVDHLNKFKLAIGANNSIKYIKDKTQCRVSLYSYVLRDSLRKWGFYKDKSYSLQFPNVPNEYASHFIRGIFDGDGCLSVGKNTYKHGKNPSYSLSFCGTANVVESIKHRLMIHCNASDAKLQININGFATVSWGGNRNVERLLDWIYKDAAIYLDRKYLLYKRLKENNASNNPPRWTYNHEAI
jgi:intein-encoded DNA endonuclease-like protein